MFSPSRLHSFTPWRFARNSLLQAHESFNWPQPQTACKILFDTPDMPPKLKLIFFSILRSRHLLLCTSSTSSNNNSSSSNTKSSFAATVRAYSSALKAANDIYDEHTFNNKKPLHHQIRYETASTIGELNAGSLLPDDCGLWTPVKRIGGGASIHHSSASRSRLLMQPAVSDEFANYQKSGKNNNNNNNAIHVITEIEKRKSLSPSEKKFLIDRIVKRQSNNNNNKMSTNDNSHNKNRRGSVIVETKDQPKSVQAPPMPSISRLRLPEVPSLVAEVWSYIESDGVLKFVENMIRRSTSQQQQEENNNNNDHQSAFHLDLRTSADLLSHLFASRDHLLFNQEALDRLSLLAFDVLSVLRQNIVHQTAQSSENSDDETIKLLSLAFTLLTTNLSSSLRLRGGRPSSAKMTKFLLFTHSLSTSTARFRHIGAQKTVPDLSELALPLRIVEELSCVLMLTGDDDSISTLLLEKLLRGSINVVRDDRSSFLAVKNQHFENQLQEIADLKEKLEAEEASKRNNKRNNNNNNKTNEVLRQQENHLAKVVERHAHLSDESARIVNEAMIDAVESFLILRQKSKKQQLHSLLQLAKHVNKMMYVSERSSSSKVIEINKEQKKRMENMIKELLSEEIDMSLERNTTTSSRENDDSSLVEWTDNIETPLSTGLQVMNRKKALTKKSFVVFSKSDIQSKLVNTKLDDIPSSTILFFRWLIHNYHHQNNKDNSTSTTNVSLQKQNKKESIAVEEEELQREQKRAAFFKSSEASSLELLFGSTSSISKNFGRPVSSLPRTFSFPRGCSSSASHQTSSSPIRFFSVNPALLLTVPDETKDGTTPLTERSEEDQLRLQQEEGDRLFENAQETIVVQVETDANMTGEEIGEMLRNELALSSGNKDGTKTTANTVVKFEMPKRIMTSEVIVKEDEDEASYVVVEAFTRSISEMFSNHEDKI